MRYRNSKQCEEKPELTRHTGGTKTSGEENYLALHGTIEEEEAYEELPMHADS